MSFYYGTLENDGYGGRGGKGGKKSGTKGSAKTKTGTTSKAAKVAARATKKPGFASRLGSAAVGVAENIPVLSNVIGAGEAIYNAFAGDGNVVLPGDASRSATPVMQRAVARAASGSPVMGADGMWYMKRKKKSRKGLSGSDLKGYMRTVKLAKLLIHTPRYMKKSVKKRRHSSF
jgi:hypothetical protein